MAIKRKGVVAVPGEYKYGDLVEIKTAEELKDAAERHPIIPLVMGHPIDGFPTAKGTIGTLSQRWDEKTNKVLGEFWFHDEKISDKLKMKLEANDPVPISAGYLLDSVDADGTQHGMVYTHMAILDGEDPKCPLGICGINVRMESNPTKIVRFEQSSELTVQKEEPEVAPVKEEEVKLDVVEPEPEPEILKTEEPAVENPEVVVAEPVEEEVKLVPEVIIPTDTPVHKEYEVDGRGWVTFTPRKYTEK
jgi:hypothetical protein